MYYNRVLGSYCSIKRRDGLPSSSSTQGRRSSSATGAAENMAQPTRGMPSSSASDVAGAIAEAWQEVFFLRPSRKTRAPSGLLRSSSGPQKEEHFAKITSALQKECISNMCQKSEQTHISHSAERTIFSRCDATKKLGSAGRTDKT